MARKKLNRKGLAAGVAIVAVVLILASMLFGIGQHSIGINNGGLGGMTLYPIGTLPNGTVAVGTVLSAGDVTYGIWSDISIALVNTPLNQWGTDVGSCGNLLSVNYYVNGNFIGEINENTPYGPTYGQYIGENVTTGAYRVAWRNDFNDSIQIQNSGWPVEAYYVISYKPTTYGNQNLTVLAEVASCSGGTVLEEIPQYPGHPPSPFVNVTIANIPAPAASAAASSSTTTQMPGVFTQPANTTSSTAITTSSTTIQAGASPVQQNGAVASPSQSIFQQIWEDIVAFFRSL